MTPLVRVRTLGPFRAATAAGLALDATGKLAALLALIAVERSVTRERALSLLWDGVAEESARHALRQALVRLKQVVGDGCIDSERDALRAGDALWCDAVAFEAAAGDRRFDEALQLYGGAFLDGLVVRSHAFSHWQDRRAAGFAVQFRTAARAHVARLLDEERLEEAVQCAHRWSRLAPDDDEAQHRLIELLAAVGRRSEAIEHYVLYQAALARDELEPLEETVALIEQIRSGAALGGLSTMVRPRQAAARTRRFGSTTAAGPRLVRIAEGGVEAESHYLDHGVNRIGREGCDICFPHDAAMADVHAEIEVAAATDGGVRMVLRDPHGAGVYLRIHTEWPLRDGDCFRAGQQQFRIELR